MTNLALSRIKSLPVWQGDISIEALKGGRTNLNFTVRDRTGKYVVRLGEDIPAHHVLRFNELAASRAAHAAGLSPEVVFSDTGITVFAFIEGKTLTEKDIGQPEYLPRVVELMRRCHHDVARHLRGPSLVFWVFHVIRDYAATLQNTASRHTGKMAKYLDIAAKLEAAIGPIELVYGHNDMMAANILDDGQRLWLIDWDYAGFNSPLFDLAGLAGNNLLSPAQELEMLSLYFKATPDSTCLHRYYAMKCAALLRETMWSMVSESISDLDIDYAGYTQENITRFRQAHKRFAGISS
ncbi:MAG: phosphotransferase [Rhodobacteraceae bacterium]|nr:phosphotransferase [Paracoccaceae bacterium]